MLRYVCLVSVGLMTAVIASGAAQDGLEKDRTPGDWLEIEHAEFILPPKGSDTIAGYVAIWNGTMSGIFLESVESPDFSSVELYETKFDSGVEQTLLKQGAEVPARSELIMKSGGVHLMAYGPTRQPAAGDKIKLVFSFAKDRRMTINATILASGTRLFRHYHGEIHEPEPGSLVNK